MRRLRNLVLALIELFTVLSSHPMKKIWLAPSWPEIVECSHFGHTRMCAGNEGEVRSQPRRSDDRLSGEEKERRARREERTTNAIVGGRERAWWICELVSCQLVWYSGPGPADCQLISWFGRAALRADEGGRFAAFWDGSWQGYKLSAVSWTLRV